MKLPISTGHSREETSWKNQEVTWEKLCSKLSKPVVTNETYAEYAAMTKDNQLSIKDVGGFVGGTIRGGRRVLNSCVARSLITLDVDQCSTDFIEQVQLMYGCAMVIHSTHKHSVLTPRYRIIIPMSREVLADEYEAIARKVAGNINIETFDPTTFQPERLMFWPSVSKDVDYVFNLQDGEWLDPDKILDEYKDWRDMSEWPLSKKAEALRKKGLGKQENPLEKSGQIGVFCRAYGIDAAINKFLKDIYLKTDHDERWTYAHGSTAAGVIGYDDLFTYSYHSTDPTMGRLCNSFDLVRIHLFGSLDSDVDKDKNIDKIPANKKPSFIKMLEMMSRDGLVKKTGLTEQLRAANEAFGDMDLDWTEELECDKKGGVLPTTANLVWILNHDENLKNNLSYDEFSKRQILQRDLPWRRVEWHSRDLTEVDEANYRNYFEKNYKIVNASKVKDAIDIVIRQNAFHPVRDYLKTCVWDKVERLDTLLIDQLGAEDTPYVRAVTRKTFVAAVKRVYEPGCKYDTVLTLIGSQGLGKSRLIGSMGRQWFSDTFGSLHNNAAMENIQGVWIMEVGEMAGLKYADVEAIKLFFGKREDRFRVAYGKKTESFARQGIFIASTNEDMPLRDQSGGRRFWLVKLYKKMGDNLSEELVDQLWAEACYRYVQGESVFLDDNMESVAKGIQHSHTESDDRKSMIEHYLETLVPINWEAIPHYERQLIDDKDRTHIMERVTVEDIWFDVFKGTAKEMTPFMTKFIRNIMNKMSGWETKMFTIKNKTFRGWIRGGGVFSTAAIEEKV